MTSSTTSIHMVVKCFLQALKDGVEGGPELGVRNKAFLNGCLYRKGAESFSYQA